MEGQYGHLAKLAFSASCSGFELLASSRHCCVPTESMTMAFVELEEYISIFSLYISFFLIISFLDFMSRIAVIWISSPELSYVCHTYAMPICTPMWAENS